MTGNQSAPATEDSGYHIDEATLSADVDRVAADLGTAPTKVEYQELGAHTVKTIARRLGDGSWAGALETLGYHIETRQGVEVDTEVLVADVRRVADKVDRAPTQREYHERGQYSPAAVARRFDGGSWVAALETIGLEISEERRRLSDLPDERLRSDVARVAAELGQPPLIEEYDERGAFHPTTVSRRFGGGFWGDALESLGYDPAESGPDPDPVADAVLRDAVAEVVDDMGRPPMRTEFDDHTEFDSQAVANRFGNGMWGEAMATLGYDTSDLVQPATIPAVDLENDLERVRDALGHVPTAQEYNDRGRYAAQTIANRFGDGSWTTALERLGHDRSESRPPNSIPTDALEADVREVVDRLGEPPTMHEYRELGTYSPRTVAERLGDGSWTAALERFDDD